MRFMLAISLIIAASAPNYVQSVAISPAPKMPGRLVETDAGHRLHLWCIGEGTPTVILVGGLGSYSIDWALVQPGVAENTRVCSYDRAGYAWSEKGPEPRGFGVSVAELHQVLQRANVRPPYVLVGHSWGGQIIRIFAHKYPDDVAGMVLIDTNPATCTAPLAEDVLAKLDTHAEEESNVARLHLPADLQAARNWARDQPGQQPGEVNLLGGMRFQSSTQNLSQEISDLKEPDRAITETTAANKVPSATNRCSSSVRAVSRGMPRHGRAAGRM